MIEPINPKIVNHMIDLRGPEYFTQSPPNKDPALIPIMDAVERTVI